jgi:hypothetical protein
MDGSDGFRGIELMGSDAVLGGWYDLDDLESGSGRADGPRGIAGNGCSLVGGRLGMAGRA